MDKPITSHNEDSKVFFPSTLTEMPMAPDAQTLARAVQLAEEVKTKSVGETAREEWRIICFSLIILLACLGQGYDSGNTNIATTMPAFLVQFGELNPITESLVIPSMWLSLFTAMTSAGIAVGALLTGLLLDRFGPRRLLFGANFWMIAAVGLQVGSHTRIQLLMGKMFAGVPQGIFMTTAATYISEIASVRIRAPLLALIPMMGIAGVIFGVALGVRQLFEMNPWMSFKLLFALQWLLPLMNLIGLIFTPDSPVYLIKKNQPEKALASITKLYGSQASNLRERLAMVQLAVAHEVELSKSIGNPSFADCFRGTDRKRTLTVIGIFVTQQCGGIAFGATSIYFLSTQGLEFSQVFNVSTAFLAVAIGANLLGGFMIEFFGRRGVFVYGNMVHMCILLAVGITAFFHNKASGWALSILLNTTISTQQATTGAGGYALSAEISSIRLRAKTQSLGTIAFYVSAWIFQFITPYMYQNTPGSAKWGAKVSFFYVGLTAICIVWSFFMIPETKKRSYTDIDTLYERKISPRHFSKQTAVESEREDIQ